MTTYPIPSSAPQWLQWRAATLFVPAPVKGQNVSQFSPAFRHGNDLSIFFYFGKSGSLCLISEAIVALQSEVSRLREDLQECLVQLPHIAREVGYLASVRQQRAKTRSRSQHRSTYNRWRAQPGICGNIAEVVY